MRALTLIVPLIVLTACAVGGGARGAASAVRERNQVLSNCLRGRGYRALN